MRISCPHCQAGINAESRTVGQVKTCPGCGGRFEVPVPTAAAAGGMPPSIPQAPTVSVESTVDVVPSPVTRIQNVVTVQQTAKIWKLLYVIGVVGLIVSTAATFLGLGLEAAGLTIAGVCGTVTSIAVYIIGRFGAWWFHG